MRGLLIVLVALALAGCGGSRTPVVVDTDLSSDDAVALLYLAQDRGVDLRAVTVSGTGLVHCPQGERIALDVLAVAGRPDVPVACGARTPVSGLASPPEEWRRAADGFFGVALPPSGRRAAPDGVRLLREKAAGATVLELAPMTDLALALRADRDLAGRIRRVVAMNGAFAVPGNAPDHPALETNAWIDPAARRAVLRSGVPVTLVPLDATNQVPVTTFVTDALRRYGYATPAATLAGAVLESSGAARGGSYFWDPLAAVALRRPGLVHARDQRVDGARPSVVARVDRRGFERDLLRTLLGGAPFAIPPHRPALTLTLDERGCTYRGAPSLTAGESVIDTVNRSAAPMQYLAGRLDQRHGVADLRRYAAHLADHPDAPPWLTPDAVGTVPPHSDMTWVAQLPAGTTGETVFACITDAPLRAWLAASVPVFAGPTS